MTHALKTTAQCMNSAILLTVKNHHPSLLKHLVTVPIMTGSSRGQYEESPDEDDTEHMEPQDEKKYIVLQVMPEFPFFRNALPVGGL